MFTFLAQLLEYKAGFLIRHSHLKNLKNDNDKWKRPPACFAQLAFKLFFDFPQKPLQECNRELWLTQIPQRSSPKCVIDRWWLKNYLLSMITQPKAGLLSKFDDEFLKMKQKASAICLDSGVLWLLEDFISKFHIYRRHSYFSVNQIFFSHSKLSFYFVYVIEW